MWQPNRLPALSDHAHHELNIKQMYIKSLKCNPLNVLNLTYFCQMRAPCLILFFSWFNNQLQIHAGHDKNGYAPMSTNSAILLLHLHNLKV